MTSEKDIVKDPTGLLRMKKVMSESGKSIKTVIIDTVSVSKGIKPNNKNDSE